MDRFFTKRELLVIRKVYKMQAQLRYVREIYYYPIKLYQRIIYILALKYSHIMKKLFKISIEILTAHQNILNRILAALQENHYDSGNHIRFKH